MSLSRALRALTGLCGSNCPSLGPLPSPAHGSGAPFQLTLGMSFPVLVRLWECWSSDLDPQTYPVPWCLRCDWDPCCALISIPTAGYICCSCWLPLHPFWTLWIPRAVDAPQARAQLWLLHWHSPALHFVVDVAGTGFLAPHPWGRSQLLLFLDDNLPILPLSCSFQS